MRTLFITVLLCLFLKGNSQKNVSFPHVIYHSFTSKLYFLGGSLPTVYKIVDIIFDKDSMILNAHGNVSCWKISYQSEMKDDDNTIDTYYSISPKGTYTTIRLIYNCGDLVDIVFEQGLINYHFLIYYPLTV